MELPLNDFQNALDAVWPFRFVIEDDGEYIRVYEEDVPVFEIHIAEVPEKDTTVPVYWGPFFVVFLDRNAGVWRYPDPVYFPGAVSLLSHIITFKDLNELELLAAFQGWEELG